MSHARSKTNIGPNQAATAAGGGHPSLRAGLRAAAVFVAASLCTVPSVIAAPGAQTISRSSEAVPHQNPRVVGGRLSLIDRDEAEQSTVARRQHVDTLAWLALIFALLAVGLFGVQSPRIRVSSR